MYIKKQSIVVIIKWITEGNDTTGNHEQAKKKNSHLRMAAPAAAQIRKMSQIKIMRRGAKIVVI